MRQSIFPNIWKSAIVRPIYKAGKQTDIANYQPIRILPIISKIMEKVVTEQLVNFLNTGHVSLHPMQFGFRKHHSTETAICYFIEQSESKLDKGGVVGAVFFYLSKAFDTVNHNVLLSKLSYFNFSENALQWMESYLEMRKQCKQMQIIFVSAVVPSREKLRHRGAVGLQAGTGGVVPLVRGSGRSICGVDGS